MVGELGLLVSRMMPEEKDVYPSDDARGKQTVENVTQDAARRGLSAVGSLW